MTEKYPSELYNGHAPHVDVSTSIDAAESIEEVSGSVRRLVLKHIKRCGTYGATDDEIEIALSLRHQTASARRRELYLLGEITSTGTRPTRSGRHAKVWIVRAALSGPLEKR